MINRFQLAFSEPALREITQDVRDFITESGIHEGLCIINVTEPDAAAMITSFWDPLGHEDILDDLRRMLPARNDYHCRKNSDTAAAHSKAAIAGTWLDIAIHNGQPTLGGSEGIFIAGFTKKENCEYTISCI